MSTIGRISSASTGIVAGATTRGNGGFSIPADHLQPSAERTPDAGSIRRAAPVNASLMLALQETSTAETGDREARQHGQRLLAALRDLQRALLSGGDDDAVDRLLLLVETMPTANDPHLAPAIASIRLRARIELERASADRPRS